MQKSTRDKIQHDNRYDEENSRKNGENEAIVDFDIYLQLKREFHLSPKEIDEIDLELAMEYGLLRRPKSDR